MVSLEDNAFMEIFELPHKGTVYLLNFNRPLDAHEVEFWNGQVIKLNGNDAVVKNAKFYVTDDLPQLYILGLLI